MHLDAGMAGAHEVHQLAEMPQCVSDLRTSAGERSPGVLEDRRVSVQIGERDEGFGVPRVDSPGIQQAPGLRGRLALQHLVQRRFPLGQESGPACERTKDTDMAHVEMHRSDSGLRQRLEHQTDDLAVALVTGVPVELRTDLDRTAPAGDALGQGVQNRPDIAQARRAGTAQAMRVDPRHLRRHVRADPHHPAGHPIGQLEGMKVEILTGAGEQRFQILDERRRNDLVAPPGEQIEQRPPQPFDPQRLGRNELVHPFGQQPALFATLHRTTEWTGSARSRSAYDVEQQTSGDHHGQAGEPERAVIQLREGEHRTSQCLRIQERHDTLQHQHERQRDEQVVPHVVSSGPSAPGGTGALFSPHRSPAPDCGRG